MPSPLRSGFSFSPIFVLSPSDMSTRIRVATAQYGIRPVSDFDAFRAQVSSVVATAADYRAALVVLPEYLSTQLLSLGDMRRPIREQVRSLCEHSEAIFSLFGELARRHKIHIVGGTTPVLNPHTGRVENHAPVAAPSGEVLSQAKLHMTRFEAEDWDVHSGGTLRIFDTAFGKMAVAICYDVEFPELVRAAAREGARILAVPSCTDDRMGWFRVRACAQARAIENQMYIVHSSTVGGLPGLAAVALNYGQAGLLTPSDYPFARDGVLADGVANQEMLVVGEFDMQALEHSLEHGTVRPLKDSAQTASLISQIEHVALR